eukprot:CAMPEP_0169449936 /NCGR_PEP_ID=MMETSP1042-20121227/12887_1 /TAXON_ID=464988 /ORGANISM="Hemiselmis andersenii, Strain CCMP1180" /LENGTH=464 /DNA_ID=CAMNT_0009561729 /DNA_START=118 /DNA_END=1508 /DNA_ORIENTATION=+
MGGTARNSSPAVAPTPRAGTVDGQLRIAFRQITRNGCMGLDQAAFVGAHFGVDSKVMRRMYKESGGGTALKEEEFIKIVKKAMSELKGGGPVDLERKNTQNPMIISKNEAMLHRGLAVLPNFLPPPAGIAKDRDPPSPTKSVVKHPTRNAATHKIPFGASSRNRPGTGASRPGTSASVRSASAPPGGPEEEARRPGTASYMAPYTPGGGGDSLRQSTAPWKWSRIDNSVPKNIRSVLLKPMRPSSRAGTPSGGDPGGGGGPQQSTLSVEVSSKLRGITRIDALTSMEDVLKDPSLFNAPVPAGTVRNALQVVGVNITEADVVSLAAEFECLEDASGLVNYRKLFTALIPITEMLSCEEVGIVPSKFERFKQQRLKITKALSSQEIALLELLRDKLKATHTSAADLRRAFKHLDPKRAGSVSHKTFLQALAMRGVGMAPEDGQVLYTVLDPTGVKGCDYNMLTAL